MLSAKQRSASGHERGWTLKELGLCVKLYTLVKSTQHERGGWLGGFQARCRTTLEGIGSEGGGLRNL
jgi:hypothetical protein